LVLAGISTQAQYFIRGEIKDETEKSLANARIIFHSTGYIYYSGTYGGFGITSPNTTDTATVSLAGYQPRTILLDSRKENTLVLKLIAKKENNQERRLVSLTRDINRIEPSRTFNSGETYSSLRENEFMPAGRFPAIDFALNTDKASYSNIRRFLNMGNTVPPDAVRIEEMLNYFDFSYEAPDDNALFKVNTRLSDCPWKPGNELFFIKASAKKLNLDNIPPSNFVFLIDVSGSMDMPNRLPLLKSAFKLMVNNLRNVDTVSIVVYGGTMGVWLTPTSGAEKEKISKAIEELDPGGATAGESGIRSAYRLAQSQFIPNGNNRVILATDGDFNVGQTSEEDLEHLIIEQRQKGIYLTCLGVGMGNYKDSKLEVLAKKGNGNFAYLDDEKEAEKVLVKELTQTMYAVADDALLHVRFNPETVKDYRLVGFENKI
jgi:Ca-activated chloride channel homolog